MSFPKGALAAHRHRSPVPRNARNRAQLLQFLDFSPLGRAEKDSLAERDEFELPVPICEQLDETAS